MKKIISININDESQKFQELMKNPAIQAQMLELQFQMLTQAAKEIPVKMAKFENMISQLTLATATATGQAQADKYLEIFLEIAEPLKADPQLAPYWPAICQELGKYSDNTLSQADIEELIQSKANTNPQTKAKITDKMLRPALENSYKTLQVQKKECAKGLNKLKQAIKANKVKLEKLEKAKIKPETSKTEQAG